MWTIQEVKEVGRNAFKLNYWPCVIVAGIYAVIFGSASVSANGSQNPAEMAANGTTTINIPEGLDAIPADQRAPLLGLVFGVGLVGLIIGLLVKAFLANPVEVGCSRFFKDNVTDPTTGVGTITVGFSDFGRTFITLLLRDVIVFVGLILFVVPGIIAIYALRFVPFIVKDNPELSPMEVLKRSNEMMRGNKWQTFLLDLSFLGWIILGAFTLTLGLFFWAYPYMQSTNATLYLALKEQ